MSLTLLENRIDVLKEIAGIERDLAVIEQRGSTADTIEIRRRLSTARNAVLSQLRDYALLMDESTETRH